MGGVCGCHSGCASGWGMRQGLKRVRRRMHIPLCPAWLRLTVLGSKDGVQSRCRAPVGPSFGERSLEERSRGEQAFLVDAGRTTRSRRSVFQLSLLVKKFLEGPVPERERVKSAIP